MFSAERRHVLAVWTPAKGEIKALAAEASAGIVRGGLDTHRLMMRGLQINTQRHTVIIETMPCSNGSFTVLIDLSDLLI